MPQALQQFDQSARTWLSGAEFPCEHGISLVNAIAKTVQHPHKMTPALLDEYGYAEFANLEKDYGSELGSTSRPASRMVETLEKTKPGLKNLLCSKAIGDNALVASLLIGQSERYWVRWR